MKASCFASICGCGPSATAVPWSRAAAALEDYLQIHGRDWERYAWVKARADHRPRPVYRALPPRIQPFVYRRYLDFGVFESLREMKALIEREVLRRDLATTSSSAMAASARSSSSCSHFS